MSLSCFASLQLFLFRVTSDLLPLCALCRGWSCRDWDSEPSSWSKLSSRLERLVFWFGHDSRVGGSARWVSPSPRPPAPPKSNDHVQRLTTGLLLSKLFSGEEKMGLLFVLPTWEEEAARKTKDNSVSPNIHRFPTEAQTHVHSVDSASSPLTVDSVSTAAGSRTLGSAATQTGTERKTVAENVS